MAGARKTEEAKNMYDEIGEMTQSELFKCFGTPNILEVLCFPYADARKKYDAYKGIDPDYELEEFFAEIRKAGSDD